MPSSNYGLEYSFKELLLICIGWKSFLCDPYVPVSSIFNILDISLKTYIFYISFINYRTFFIVMMMINRYPFLSTSFESHPNPLTSFFDWRFWLVLLGTCVTRQYPVCEKKLPSSPSHRDWKSHHDGDFPVEVPSTMTKSLKPRGLSYLVVFWWENL